MNLLLILIFLSCVCNLHTKYYLIETQGGHHPTNQSVRRQGRGDHALGRPFLVQGISRTTCSQTCSNTNLNYDQLWKMGETPSVLSNNQLNEEIGRYWLKQAEAEHASVASFARHTLQLMSIGAPARLLIASMEAGLDEINHAKISYGLASAFIGLDFGPGSFNVDGSLESMDLRDIIGSIIREGCIGETLSAVEAQFAAHVAEDPAVKAALLKIAFDETKHGQLAWDTIKWAIETFPDMRKFADNIFDMELEQRKTPTRNDTSLFATTLCEASEKETSFHRYGLLFLKDREKVRETGIRDIIEPVYHDGFKNVNMISKLIKGLDVTSLFATTLCEASEKETSFHRYGLLFLKDREKVRETGIRDIIEPIYHDGFKNVNMISKLIKGLDVTTL